MKFRFLGVIFFTLAAVNVLARDPSFNAQNYKPATDSGYYWGVYGSQPLLRGEFSLGFSTDYSHRPVTLTNAGVTRDLIGREVSTHLFGTYGVLDWLDVGLLISSAPYLQFFPTATTEETRSRMGDILITSRFRLVDQSKYPVGLSLMPMLAAPTGSGASFVGNNRIAGGGMLVLDSRRIADRFSVAFNLGYEVRQSAQISTQTTIDDLLLYGVAGNVGLHPKLDLIGEIRGFTLAEDPFDSQQRPMEFEIGARYYPASRWAVGVAGGGSLMEGTGNPVYRVIAGLSYIPSREGFKRQARQEKPKQEKRKKVEEVADSDGDGLKDNLDRCPTEVGPADNGGCPPAPKVVITPDEYRILTRPIYFDFEKATLRSDSLPVLNSLADAMKVKPTIRKLSIEGHCDELGTEKFNQWLSEERAKMVMSYLLDRGVESDRLVTIGFGKSRPVDSAHHARARRKNRRVEFVFVEVEGLTVPEQVPPSEAPTLPEKGPVKVPPLEQRPEGLPPIPPYQP